uniref:Uncharacterized protein n=1 Tax=Clastoptera arizonana TaxID=38151 RepID=A0A1B6DZ30_9HEMI
MAIKKICPFCGLQVAVAYKTCPGCKHSFSAAKKNDVPHTIVSEEGQTNRRRTERVRREKPNYYDASEFEKKTKKKKSDKIKIGANPRGRPPNSTQGLKSRKKKGSKKKEQSDDSDSGPNIVLNAEKELQCSIILADINRKFMSTMWKP